MRLLQLGTQLVMYAQLNNKVAFFFPCNTTSIVNHISVIFFRHPSPHAARAAPPDGGSSRSDEQRLRTHLPTGRNREFFKLVLQTM